MSTFQVGLQTNKASLPLKYDELWSIQTNMASSDKNSTFGWKTAPSQEASWTPGSCLPLGVKDAIQIALHVI